MGDEQHGLAVALPDVEQIVLQPRSGVRVQRAERLVHQQHRGVIGQRAGQRDALLHAAGQLLGIEILKALEADHLDQRAALRFGLRGLYALLARAIHHVAEHALPGKQRELLKHRSAIGPGPGDRPALHPGDASGRADEAADDIKQRRFSAAGGTEDRDKGAILDCQRNFRQRQMVLAAGGAENLRDTVDLDHGGGRRARRHGSRLDIWPLWHDLHFRFSSWQGSVRHRWLSDSLWLNRA